MLLNKNNYPTLFRAFSVFSYSSPIVLYKAIQTASDVTYDDRYDIAQKREETTVIFSIGLKFAPH